MKNKEKIVDLISDLGWERDRMSQSGVETWEKLCALVGIDLTPPTEEELAQFKAEMKKLNG